MIVSGIDLSLAKSGLAKISTPREPLGLGIALDRLRTDPKHYPDTMLGRAARLRDIVAGCRHWVGDSDLIVIEAPSLGQGRQAGEFDRAGAWWLLVSTLLGDLRTVVAVTPGGRSKYATGKGGDGKAAVMLAADRRYRHLLPVQLRDDNEADALVLAAMGARWLGEPIEESLPKPNLEAMAKVQWPERVPT